ncbi:MAG: hypothetical protein SFT90_00160 [Rickettsiales bacterium]|nr:hypothetical protein [Rickettsiales bacterium]
MNKFYKKSILFPILLILISCSPSLPKKHFATENFISIRYNAYDEVPTLTAEAMEMALEHCKSYGKFANYKGGNAKNPFSSEEIHQFACENKKSDDAKLISSQLERPSHIYISK